VRLKVHAQRARHAAIALPGSLSPLPRVLAATRRQSEASSLCCPLHNPPPPPLPPPTEAFRGVRDHGSVESELLRSCRCRCNMWCERTLSGVAGQVCCQSAWMCSRPQPTCAVRRQRFQYCPLIAGSPAVQSIGGNGATSTHVQVNAAPNQHCSVLGAPGTTDVVRSQVLLRSYLTSLIIGCVQEALPVSAEEEAGLRPDSAGELTYTVSEAIDHIGAVPHAKPATPCPCKFCVNAAYCDAGPCHLRLTMHHQAWRSRLAGRRP